MKTNKFRRVKGKTFRKEKWDRTDKENIKLDSRRRKPRTMRNSKRLGQELEISEDEITVLYNEDKRMNLETSIGVRIKTRRQVK